MLKKLSKISHPEEECHRDNKKAKDQTKKKEKNRHVPSLIQPKITYFLLKL